MIGAKMMGGESAPAAPADAPVGVDEEQTNVSPEEQAQYEAFVRNGLEIIYPQGENASVSPNIMEDLRGGFSEEERAAFVDAQPPLGDTPNDALAATAVLLVLVLDASAEAAGKPIADDVVMHAGVALLEELAEVSEAAGIHDHSEEELEAATYRAFDLFRVASPRIDQDALKQQFGQIVEADQAGGLDKLLPGIGQRLNGGEPAADVGQR